MGNFEKNEKLKSIEIQKTIKWIFLKKNENIEKIEIWKEIEILKKIEILKN